MKPIRWTHIKCKLLIPILSHGHTILIRTTPFPRPPNREAIKKFCSPHLAGRGEIALCQLLSPNQLCIAFALLITPHPHRAIHNQFGLSHSTFHIIRPIKKQTVSQLTTRIGNWSRRRRMWEVLQPHIIPGARHSRGILFRNF